MKLIISCSPKSFISPCFTLPHYIYSSTVLYAKYNIFMLLYTLWGWNVFKINHTFTSCNIKVLLTHECISDYDPLIIPKTLFYVWNFKYILVLLKVFSWEEFYKWIHAVFISSMHTNKAVNVLTLWFHAILCYSSKRQLVAVTDQRKKVWRANKDSEGRRLTASKHGCTQQRKILKKY